MSNNILQACQEQIKVYAKEMELEMRKGNINAARDIEMKIIAIQKSISMPSESPFEDQKVLTKHQII